MYTEEQMVTFSTVVNTSSWEHPVQEWVFIFISGEFITIILVTLLYDSYKTKLKFVRN